MKIGFTDVHQVGPVMVSRENVSEDRITSHYSAPAEMGTLVTYYKSRVTYSVPLQFDESEPEREARLMAFHAAQDAEAGRSVRRRAETYETVSVGDPGDSENKASRDAGIKAWKIHWAHAYLAYTKGRPHLSGLYIDAMNYLNELEGRRRRPTDQFGNPSDPEGRRQLEEWMRLHEQG